MRKKPYFQSELFDTIVARLEAKGVMPDILDYSLADRYSNDRPITNYEFGFGNNLDYGGNEGIYLNILIVGYDRVAKENFRRHIGTFKTLDTGYEAMHTMANLLADFVIEGRAFVEDNLDDFTWENYDIGYIDAEGKTRYVWSDVGELNLEKRKNELFEKHDKIVVRDNSTKKEKVYEREVA